MHLKHLCVGFPHRRLKGADIINMGAEVVPPPPGWQQKPFKPDGNKCLLEENQISEEEIHKTCLVSSEYVDVDEISLPLY